jgi:hypothetical protein
MQSIAQQVAHFFAQHIACISVTTAMAIWTALNTWWHKRIDGQIMRVVNTNPPLSTYKISTLIETRVSKTESRLWDLMDRGKVSENTATGERLWGKADQMRAAPRYRG